MTDTKVSKHYNNWPTNAGFEANVEQRQPVELKVTGKIPSYAAGTLYRTGPGRDSIPLKNGTRFQIGHWFDGFGQTHRFQIIPTEAGTQVLYNSRFQSDSRYEYVGKTGKEPVFLFGRPSDPCELIFEKAQTEWDPADPGMYEVNVTLSQNMPGAATLFPQIDGSQHKDMLVVKTDAWVYKALDSQTMDVIGLATQNNLLSKLDGHLSASHARTDPNTGDVFNYNCSAEGDQATYRVFTISAKTQETTVLAEFKDFTAYIHSFALTKDYVILCVWNAHLQPGDNNLIERTKKFDPSIPSKWYVVSRHGDGLVAKYDGPAFFCFHTCNAWQEEDDIVVDLLRYDDHEYMNRVYYKYMKSDSDDAAKFMAERTDVTRAVFARFRLPAAHDADKKQVVLDWEALRDLSPELPTYNGKMGMQPTRYTYMLTDRNVSTFFDGIAKFDAQTKEVVMWESHAQSPGEALFVADPNGKAEDDGVLLSVVLDGKSGKSYLLCLDAKTMQELGRAQAHVPVGFGFHGQHIRAGKPYASL